MSNNQQSSKTFTLYEGTGSYDIQQEVRYLLSFPCLCKWEKELHERGKRHKNYYHYTTLKAVKDILHSSSWMLKKATSSNDPTECPVHSSSFTYSSLSSMGMWSQYSEWGKKKHAEEPKKCTCEIGVRIAIPKDVFTKVFSGTVLYQKIDNDSESEKPSYRLIENLSPIEITDVAYWYFGKDGKGQSDLLFYKDYCFPFNALGLYDSKTYERRDRKVFYERPNPEKPILPCFKRSIWRSEKECRVYVDLRTRPDVPDEIFVGLSQDDISKIRFILEPGLDYDETKGECSGSLGTWNLKGFFDRELEEGKITLGQFLALSKTDYWENDDNEDTNTK